MSDEHIRRYVAICQSSAFFEDYFLADIHLEAPWRLINSLLLFPDMYIKQPNMCYHNNVNNK